LFFFPIAYLSRLGENASFITEFNKNSLHCELNIDLCIIVIQNKIFDTEMHVMVEPLPTKTYKQAKSIA